MKKLPLFYIYLFLQRFETIINGRTVSNVVAKELYYLLTIFQPHIFDRSQQALKLVQLLEIIPYKIYQWRNWPIVKDDICLSFSLLFISWKRAVPGNSLSVHNAFRISNLAGVLLLVFSPKYCTVWMDFPKWGVCLLWAYLYSDVNIFSLWMGQFL